MDIVLTGLILGAYFGVPYLLIVGVTYIAWLVGNTLAFHWGHVPAMVLPIGVSILLELGVKERAGFNFVWVNLCLAASMIGLMRMLASTPAALASIVSALLGVAMAVALWKVIPMQGLTRLF
jgi:hypothetical protein